MSWIMQNPHFPARPEPIVEHAFAFPEIVVHGETGFLAGSSDEMSEYASLLAADPD